MRSSACIEDWITSERGSHDRSVGYGVSGDRIFGHGNSNLPSPKNFDSSFSKTYMYSSGASMATPVAAGACAIVRQFLQDLGVNPSGALTKALVIRAAVDLGQPRNKQG